MKKKLESKEEKKQSEYCGHTNLTEYLFADKYGQIGEKIDPQEINQIYLAYLSSLVDSYERLTSKFNQF